MRPWPPILLTAHLVCHVTPAVSYAADLTGFETAPAYALMVGDKAPVLHVAKWIKGKPIPALELGVIYVLDIWSTWCGPCLAGMPDLTALQKRYQNRRVQIIGLTSPDDYGNTLTAVETMVRTKGSTIGYTIAWDAPSATPYLGVFKGRTNAVYMKAAGLTGLPVCFVVDREGRIAYIGHPMGLDTVVKELVAGRWDMRAAAAQYRARREAEPLLATYQEAMKAERYTDAYRLARKLLASALWDDPRSMLIVSDTIVSPAGKVRQKDLDIALTAATRAATLTHYRDPGMLDALARVYFVKGDRGKAIELVTQAIRRAEGGQKSALEKVRQTYRSAP